MTVTFYSGFELANTGDWTSLGWTPPTVQSDIKKTGSYALRCHMSDEEYGECYVSTISDFRQGSLWICITEAPSVHAAVLGSISNTSVVGLTDDLYVILLDSTVTQRGISASPLSLDTWYRISYGAGATTEKVYVGGVEVISYESGSQLACLQRVGLSSLGGEAFTGDIYIDDVCGNYVSSTDDIGDLRVVAAVPRAAGNYTGFDGYSGSANHWDNCDEIPYSETDYVKHEASTSKRDTYLLTSCANLGLSATDVIQSVKTLARIKRVGTDSTPHSICVRDDGTDATTACGGTTSYVWRVRTDDVMPKDSAAWTQARFDTFEAGPGHLSTSTTDTHCAVVTVMVCYLCVPAGANITVTPTTLSLTITTYAPTIIITGGTAISVISHYYHSIGMR